MVVGVGGMGLACARRLGVGRRLVVADYDEALSSAVAQELQLAGFDVVARTVDVADAKSVRELAHSAGSEGELRAVVHTAGLSPTMANARRILEVDLVGTANVIDAFCTHARQGTVVVCIASMAGHFWPMDRDTEVRLATAPAAQLIDVAGLPDDSDPGIAYAFAKRANIARVKGAATAYGARGARIVSISPGIIATGMGVQELEQQPVMSDMLARSPVPRIGTADDIARAVEWLVSDAASFVTGTDLLVDGGVVAATALPGEADRRDAAPNVTP
ncbi:MAG: family oxidoreductase [Actinomycetia bacterium]|nr:family oxidoreductase [Actinomycetes bacterium]